ncbi:hypothetical protein CD30_17275 [Ureibacillus massiliensis 4400831 = CIP 108448 = CCUG 49529]|uniref:LysM domain-containing protein n=1 Tax=Ureibacillus massiliensis 4400831 = CIP 108448 = CCUG 49529 TaxID=1211035 RepID=A0A0A3IXA2_9BACL|nr:LysM peptidoglycan-binding domain-containing protein [Ureibacillus massiliensis]KGR89311.1 hypothetical protein CD30_17275 [Ureibacillus massiliensis 4400831 = CIP 108448 = CCUG 49529]
MKWLQKNSYITVLFTTFLLIAAYVVVTDEGETSYEQIEVQHGDSLWSLANKYKGDMSLHQWIETVKVENDLRDETIVAGGELTIPIPADTLTIAQDSEEITTVKVATNNE